MGQQWPGTLCLCWNTEQIPPAKAPSAAPYLLGKMHPWVGQCLCSPFPVSLWLNLRWPLSMERPLAEQAIRCGEGATAALRTAAPCALAGNFCCIPKLFPRPENFPPFFQSHHQSLQPEDRVLRCSESHITAL